MRHLLLSLFEHSTEYKSLYSSILESISPILIHGSEANVVKWLASKSAHDLQRHALVLFEDDHKAKRAAEDMMNAVYLPTKEMVWFDAYAHSNQVALERVEALLLASSGDKNLIFTSIQNMAYKFPRRLHHTITIDMETAIPLKELQKSLFEFGYDRVDIVESKGQYSLRGGILDVFSPLYDMPFRLEFFGDDVDSIRQFDLETQVSVQKLEQVILYPCQEMVLTDSRIEDILDTLTALRSRYKASKREKLDELIERLRSGLSVDGLDKYLPLIDNDAAYLTEVLNHPIVFIVGNNASMNRLRQYTQEYTRQFSEYLERGDVISEQFERIFSFEQVSEALMRETLILDELLIKRTDVFQPEQILKLTSREMNKYFGKMEQLALDIDKWRSRGYMILVCLSTQERLERFSQAMLSFDIPVHVESVYESVSPGQVIAGISNIQLGFYFDTFKAVVLTENEIFGEGKRISRRSPNQGKVIKAFSELNVGDLVVHENHGIGKYVGVEQVKIDLTKKDFLKIKYAQDDFLYIPVESAGSIQKYMGTDKEKIKLNKLGGTEWKRTKQRAKKAIEDMTDELIELYAQRKTRSGYAFSPDSEWQREFEGLFPYQETRDQLKCIQEIKNDMESALPMERLLCGDVGYGKTEVALRAAFKAVLDSKQVAILVPTTILAQQHYTNAVERFSKYPARIEMLSRFRSKGEQDKIAKDISNGVIDVVIGTHRLLSKDVRFKDLGLLVIDEEQRFGVKHKEKIKQLKESIDVLSLSATPIPRTLHMSMIGIRDMSVLEDPPEDRYPIQTYVVEFDENLVKEAIVRELERGGQVYFVHNRVSDISDIAAKLQDMIPEANVHYAHGQMNEHELEKLMMDFMNNVFNVLVCTTIIETGLDISNVNTIIINDGDRFGLSQLYQLRGRVGRSNRLAYCYIFYQVNKVLNDIAEKRLKAIKEFTELGAGFKIAMRDLEIRGTGNVLGTAQHGHMEAIGYELYCKMLEESLLSKKGERILEKPQAKMDFAMNAYIPEAYISNPQIKIEIYKKIASVTSREDVDAVYEEIEDRFGTVPTSVDNLLRIAYVKALCEFMSIEEVTEDGKTFTLKFIQDALISPLLVSQAVAIDPQKITFIAKNPALLKIKVTNTLRNKEEQLKMLENMVEKIYSFHSDYINV